MTNVGIIGGGIAGLTAAFYLQQADVSVRILEASPRVGGMIQTERIDGYLIEHGPNSLRAASDVLVNTLEALGLREEVIPAQSASRRYVVHDGTPKPLPSSPWSFLTSDLLSLSAKMRLLREPFIPASEDANESVASFVRRRLGPEVLDYAVNPFVGGIFAGDPERLSLRHAFSKLFELEREHGSLFRGMMAGSRSGEDNAPPDAYDGVFSLRGGLATLVNALAETVEDQILYNAPVTALRRDDRRWHVASKQPDGSTRMDFFDAVICTVPLHRIAAFDLETSVDLSPLGEVAYPPLSVVALGYDAADVAHPLDGFGMLVPEVEDQFGILGTIFSSTLFPGRAPDGTVLLTTFVGGSRRPDLAAASTDALVDQVHADLQALLGVSSPPSFVRRIEWTHAIPQYELGYERVVDALKAFESEHPGLFLAGNFRDGISVPDTMTSARRAAEDAGTVVQTLV